jgi:hypothetical protein
LSSEIGVSIGGTPFPQSDCFVTRISQDAAEAQREMPVICL